VQWWAEKDEEDAANEEESFACPYCWEQVTPPLEADLEGELVWDCEVCCKPWLIRIRVGLCGERHVSVDRAQG